MKGFKSAAWVLGATLPMLMAACEVDQPISPHSKGVDSGQSGAAGKSSTGASGSVSNGNGGSNGSSGTLGNGGVGVSGAGGSAGSGGSADLDASADASGDDVVETGPTTPEASTCAGFALQFAGVGDYGSIDRIVQDDFTLEAWFKTSATLTGNNFWDGAGLIYADTAGNHDDFGSSILNDKVAFGMGNITTDAAPTELTMQSTTSVTTGQWVHLAVTRNKTTGLTQIILNGQVDASTVAENHNSLTQPTAITLGGNTVDGRYFTGTMDELRIWNIVRTPAEITSTMHRTLAGNEAGLVGYWGFDEGTGTSSTGKVGGNASLYNNPQWIPSDAPICP